MTQVADFVLLAVTTSITTKFRNCEMNERKKSYDILLIYSFYFVNKTHFYFNMLRLLKHLYILKLQSFFNRNSHHKRRSCTVLGKATDPTRRERRCPRTGIQIGVELFCTIPESHRSSGVVTKRTRFSTKYKCYRQRKKALDSVSYERVG